MSRLVMWNLITLDGLFEGPKPWDLDFHNLAWGEELERLSIEQLRGADRLLFGRATYEGMAAHWRAAEGTIADLMNSVPKVVFSRTLTAATWNNTVLVRDDVPSEVAALKRNGDGSTFVFGSASLSATLTRHGLFDEYRLVVVPVILGAGVPLFGGGPDRLDLRLLESRTLANGCVILRYAPAGAR